MASNFDMFATYLSQVFHIICTGVGSHGCGHRRYASIMALLSGICPSSLRYDSTGPKQAETVSGCKGKINSPSLEKEIGFWTY